MNMLEMATPRRPTFGPSPVWSAAMPVIVRVSTVVVRSGTASLRATAFCRPMATKYPNKRITVASGDQTWRQDCEHDRGAEEPRLDECGDTEKPATVTSEHEAEPPAKRSTDNEGGNGPMMR